MRYSEQNCEVVDFRQPLLKKAVGEICSIIRRHRLSYDQTSYVVREARKALEQKPEKRGKRLPKSLTRDQVDKFFCAVKQGGDGSHQLLFELLYGTACRVSEIANVRREDVDLDGLRIMVRRGKGDRDRVVMFPSALRLPLQIFLDSTKECTYLFETRRREKFSSRWIQVLAKRYGEAAGIQDMHPHRLRHSLLTHLASDMTDAQLQAVSGHASRSSLQIYAELSQRDVAGEYQRLMG